MMDRTPRTSNEGFICRLIPISQSLSLPLSLSLLYLSPSLSSYRSLSLTLSLIIVSKSISQIWCCILGLSHNIGILKFVPIFFSAQEIWCRREPRVVDSQNANALWIVFTYPVLQLGPYLENILVIEQIFAGITTHAKLVKFTLGPNIHPWLGSTMVEPLLSYPQHGVSSVRGHIALAKLIKSSFSRIHCANTHQWRMAHKKCKWFRSYPWNASGSKANQIRQQLWP